MATGVARKFAGIYPVWVNPNVAQSFDAQRVDVDVSKYDELIFIVSAYMTSEVYIVRGPTPKVTAVNPTVTWLRHININPTYADQQPTQVVLNGVTRSVDVYPGGLIFGHGQMIYNGGFYKDWDNRAIPYKIFGVIY